MLVPEGFVDDPLESGGTNTADQLLQQIRVDKMMYEVFTDLLTCVDDGADGNPGFVSLFDLVEYGIFDRDDSDTCAALGGLEMVNTADLDFQLSMPTDLPHANDNLFQGDSISIVFHFGYTQIPGQDVLVEPAMTRAASGGLLSDDFESGGAPDWTLSGLWRVDNDCVTPHQGNYALVYSRDHPDCDYDVGANSGTAQTPSFDASGYNQVVVEFFHFWETEPFGGSFDRLIVKVSGDGGASYTQLLMYDAQDANPPDWFKETLDISAHATTDTVVAFEFDSVDGQFNDFLGWYVDDLQISGS